MEKYLLLVFGPSWRTSLIGYAGSALLELGIALDAIPNPTWKGWHIVALVVLALARAMKDSAVTGGTIPATPEATGRVRAGSDGIAPLLALFALFAAGPTFAADPPPADPTIGLDPGTAIADAVANETPEFRGGTYLEWLPGAPALVPAVAISPFALSLRDGSVSPGLTVGAGYELLWHATEASARGVAVYGNMRSTSDGPRALVSVLGIVTPYLGLGAGYQIGGGAASFRDAAVLLLSVGTNLGLASR